MFVVNWSSKQTCNVSCKWLTILSNLKSLEANIFTIKRTQYENNFSPKYTALETFVFETSACKYKMNTARENTSFTVPVNVIIQVCIIIRYYIKSSFYKKHIEHGSNRSTLDTFYGNRIRTNYSEDIF